ncbi:hypothetical protein V6N11_021888 [Hibiscus sabdariffa]|uniref:C2H2-type domain-containing protein n=1 Tax=Hibiscus sabdariffa TaxID=183260 RepID=A0ABR2TI56_9ROSI
MCVGAEVKGGQIFKVELENDNRRILHLSQVTLLLRNCDFQNYFDCCVGTLISRSYNPQVALGEVTGDNKKEKGNETIYIYLKFKNDNFVIGTLSQEKFPQLPLDLVLNDTFELSHTWKNGSIHITGYHVDTSQGGEKFPQLPLDLVLNDTFELSHTWKNGSIHITGYHVDTSQGGADVESEEELPQPTINLTKPHATASDPAASQHVKIVEPIKDEGSSDDEDEDDTSEDEDSSEDQEPAMPINGEKESKNDTDSDEDDSEEESSDEDQETPEKAGPSKKRSAESARKTPAPEKKAKLVTPQRTDSKKVGGHTATPHPSKQAKKASAAAKAKQTPKSGGSSFPCKSCGRSFGSENALQSHSKAKHGAAAV